MDKFKRLLVTHRSTVFFAMEIAILIIGAYVAYLTVYRFEIFVKAALGLTIHYLFYLEYFVFRRMHDSESFFVKFDFPKDMRYFIIDFFVVIILVWAGLQVLDMVRYLIRLFISS